MSKLQERAIARFLCKKFNLTASTCDTDNDFLACQTSLYTCQRALTQDRTLTTFMTAKEVDNYLFQIERGLEEVETQIRKWRNELDSFHNSFHADPAEFAKLVAKLEVE